MGRVRDRARLRSLLIVYGLVVEVRLQFLGDVGAILLESRSYIFALFNSGMEP